MVCIKDFSANQLRFSHHEGPAVFAPCFNHSSGTKVVLRPAPAHFTFYAENSLAQRVHGDSEQSQKSKTPLLNYDEADHHNMLICHRNSRNQLPCSISKYCICKSHLICHLMLSIFSTQKHLRQNFRKNLGAVASSRNAPRLITLRTHWPFWKPAMKDTPQKRCFRQGAPDGCEELFQVSSYLSRFCPTLCTFWSQICVSLPSAGFKI